MKGSNYLEIMSKLHTVVFDKTGTLTKGEFKVARIYSVDEEADIAGNGENESDESAENGTDPRSESRERYWNWLHWLKAIRIIRSHGLSGMHGERNWIRAE